MSYWRQHELMIGRTQFDPQQGPFYPNGTVRRTEQVEAVMDGSADFLTEKPDREAHPRSSMPKCRNADGVLQIAGVPD